MASVKREAVYNYIIKRWQSDGVSPSVREICAALGIKSTSSVHKYIKELEAEGLLTTSRLKNRSIVPIHARRTVNVPLIGRVAAGIPITAQENFEGFVAVSAEIAGGECFALTVKGDSMKNAGILGGDTVIVDRRDYAQNGEIVVALIEGEATVKRYFAEDGKIRLQPENENFQPIITEKAEILGKVVACMRYY